MTDTLFRLEVQTFDLDAFLQEHPDIAEQNARYVEAVRVAQANGKANLGAVASAHHLRFKVDQKIRNQLRAAREEQS